MTLFEALMEARSRLLAAEAAHPDSEALDSLHRQALRLLYKARHALGLTDAHLAQLAAPQGGGTPKTPPPEGEG